MKFSHTADLHFQDGPYLEEALKCFSQVIDYSINHKMDFMIISGDLLHKNLYIDSPAVTILGKELKRICSFMPVLVVYGNHDPKGSLELYEEFIPNLYVAKQNELVYLTDKFYKFDNTTQPINPKGFFYCIPYPMEKGCPSDKPVDEKIKEFLTESAKSIKHFNVPKIASAHLSVYGYKTDIREFNESYHLKLDTIKSIKLDYTALGHIHMAQMLDNNIWYPSSPWSTKSDEVSKKYFNVVTITDRTLVEQIPIKHRKRIVKVFKIQNKQDLKELFKYYDATKNSTSNYIKIILELEPGILNGIPLRSNAPYVDIIRKNINIESSNNETVKTIAKAKNTWEKCLIYLKHKGLEFSEESLKIAYNKYEEITKILEKDTDEIQEVDSE